MPTGQKVTTLRKYLIVKSACATFVKWEYGKNYQIYMKYFIPSPIMVVISRLYIFAADDLLAASFATTRLSISGSVIRRSQYRARIRIIHKNYISSIFPYQLDLKLDLSEVDMYWIEYIDRAARLKV